MNPIMSFVLLITTTMVLIFLVLSLSQPIIDTATAEDRLREAENLMRFIDNTINDVASEGLGSKRIISFNSPGSFQSIRQEDAIQMYEESTVIEQFPKKISGNLVYIPGSDVSCYDDENLTMENSYLKVVFQKIDPESEIDTKNNIILLKEKVTGKEIRPVNSSIVIDDNPSTAYGTGYSEIPRTGENLPACQVHFYVNSAVSYDIYYTLYAYADFLAVEIRNVS